MPPCRHASRVNVADSTPLRARWSRILRLTDYRVPNFDSLTDPAALAEAEIMLTTSVAAASRRMRGTQGVGSPPQPVRYRRKRVGLPGSAALLCMAAPCVHAAIGGVGASFQMSAPCRLLPPWSVEASRIIALSQRIIELNAGNGMVGVRLSGLVMTRLASRASTSGRGLLTFIQPQGFELSFSVRALLRLSLFSWHCSSHYGSGDNPLLPAAMVRRRTARLLCRARPQRPSARVCLFRG
jgi:hypothetical protein